jgi:hypothetical protein
LSRTPLGGGALGLRSLRTMIAGAFSESDGAEDCALTAEGAASAVNDAAANRTARLARMLVLDILNLPYHFVEKRGQISAIAESIPDF